MNNKNNSYKIKTYKIYTMLRIEFNRYKNYYL